MASRRFRPLGRVLGSQSGCGRPLGRSEVRVSEPALRPGASTDPRPEEGAGLGWRRPPEPRGKPSGAARGSACGAGRADQAPPPTAGPASRSLEPRPRAAPLPRKAPPLSRRAPPSRARAGGVAFKSSPVFWGPRAGRADLVRMSRAVTPAPGSMCAAEGRIIWPAARAGGRTGGASAAGPGGPTGGASARDPAPPAPPPPDPAGDPGPGSRVRALP